MEEAKTMKNPMSSSIKLDKDEKGKSIDSTMYRGMIGSLLYLTTSRPDIMYSVCLCARFQSCPKESHLSAVIRILRYLKETMDRSLWYPKGDNFELIGFLDVDFAGRKVERQSTGGTCHFLGHSLVSWHSKKQNSVALSMAKVEYIATGPRALDLGRVLLYLCASASFSFIFAHLGLLIGERTISRAQGKRPTEPSQLDQKEACRKARYDMNLFNSVEDYQRYKQKFAQRKVVLGRSINFFQLQYFGFERLFGRMGWLPVVTIFKLIFLTLVYESKAWPIVLSFEPREVIQRMCSLVEAQGMGKPLAHSLTLISRVLHHMICSNLLPRGRHRDEVSYIEAFLIGSILTGRRIHMGYLMMMHMISCCEKTTRVLPYDHFFTRIFKDVGIDLSRETDFEAPTIYDTYDEQSLGRMKFQKALDGSYIRRAERPLALAWG
ncbi:Retrovirus-related Pol polyprotein from transposon RE1 [Vitis vinifera]|uniref:Retrovirus-related Pol polyprotein from transposon RE1 n=1 Tax=Vitis vinifera TaxID=29760 RepID=A0A438CQ51_VITVI|nr:Retrovirus-related Pol polyprotein from transposon RE1 [Vitis vinifera]